MIQRIQTVLFTILLLLGTSIPSHADDSALAATFQTRYATLQGASDAESVKDVLAADYVTVQADGARKDRNEYLKQITAAGRGRSSDTTVLSVATDGDQATVKQRTHVRMRQTDAKGGQHDIDAVVLATDTWAKVQDQWQLKRSIVENVNASVDGKAVAPRAKATP